MTSKKFLETKCPVCGSNELRAIDGEAICMGDCCPWSSSKQSVEAGSMDYLLQLDWEEIEKSDQQLGNREEELCERIVSKTLKAFKAYEAVRSHATTVGTT